MSYHHYGFSSTVCACAECIEKCVVMSGVCSPKDIERWSIQYGAAFFTWALEHLAASPGAIVLKNGQMTRIPTIVPRREASGQCHWLDADNKCSIHAEAPYGCSVFDCRQQRTEADRRSVVVHRAIFEDFEQAGGYSLVWRLLRNAGKIVRGPEEVRPLIRREGR